MTDDDISGQFAVATMRRFVTELFAASGMDDDKASTIGEVLVEADLLGHSTHGMALVPRYLDEIFSGRMIRYGVPKVIADNGACVTWDGGMLPGVWLTVKAIDLALERVETYGVVSVAIGNGHHAGCLAAYLPRVTERGCMLTIASSSPGLSTVAPFGGIRGALSPAPFAAGFPTGAEPILIDVSSSITTNNMAARLNKEGQRLPHRWLLDVDGQATDDPSVLQRGGAILPAGGLDHGQKGYGWGLIAEVLSQGLSGHGRADAPEGVMNALFVQVIDPAAFAGRDAFRRQTDAIASTCRSSTPGTGYVEVRVPGDNALRHKRAASRDGMYLHERILEGLRPWAERLAVALPETLGH